MGRTQQKTGQTMKNTVWSFGDSYITTLEGKSAVTGETLRQYANWAEIVANKLDMELKDFGRAGSSLEFSSYKYTENHSYIQPGDIVLVVLTSFSSRKWLIFEEESMMTPVQIERSEKLSPKDKEHYQRVLSEHRIEWTESLGTLFLESLGNLLSKGVKIIAIPCFHHSEHFLYEYRQRDARLPCIKGNLLENVSYHETDGTLEQQRNLQRNEFRRNHMAKENHIVLANKVIDLVKSDASELDLTHGFHENIIKL